MHAVISLIMMLLIGMLVNTSWGQPFVTYDLRVNGAIITVIAADLRGHRRQDLIVISRTGTFPNEARWVSVFWQQEGGRFNPHPDLVWEMDSQATVIDVGRLGSESDRQSIVYLTGSEVRAYQLAGAGPPKIIGQGAVTSRSQAPLSRPRDAASTASRTPGKT